MLAIDDFLFKIYNLRKPEQVFFELELFEYLEKNGVENLFDLILADSSHSKERMIKEILNKLKIDPGQTFQEAAVREVKEEGGVEAKILEKVGYSKFIYTFEDEKIFKVVTYFLMEYISGDPKDHDWEMEEAGWYESDKALEQLTFSQDKTLLKKALEIRNG